MSFWKHWLSIIGAIPGVLAIWKGLRAIVSWAGDIDFLVSRSNEPGWIGNVINSLFNIPDPLLALLTVAGFLLILWDLKWRKPKAKLKEVRGVHFRNDRVVIDGKRFCCATLRTVN
jgi:hypothetical protein